MRGSAASLATHPAIWASSDGLEQFPPYHVAVRGFPEDPNSSVQLPEDGADEVPSS